MISSQSKMITSQSKMITSQDSYDVIECCKLERSKRMLIKHIKSMVYPRVSFKTNQFITPRERSGIYWG